MNIEGADGLVDEYLMYRGFTGSFKTLQLEKRNDKVKGFNANKIVDQIFTYIQSFDIESFISLWDFLAKRFFLHLDQEHLSLINQIKSDLIKFYLVCAVKKNFRPKVGEFFSKFSHEILNETPENSTGLRNWYVLPYLDEPERDAEFSVYFTTRWYDTLKNTMLNFFSLVLQSAPPPKLLLLERWFRSEAQQDLRLQLKQSSEHVSTLLQRIDKYEERLTNLRSCLKDLAVYVHHTNTSAVSGAVGKRSPNQNVGLFESDEEADKRREEVRKLGQSVCRLAAECVHKSENNVKAKEPPRIDSGTPYYTNKVNTPLSRSESIYSNSSVEDLEMQLVVQTQQWLRSLS